MSNLNIAAQKLFAWSGLVMGLGFFLGWGVLAGYLPPQDPQSSVQEIVDFYSTDTTSIRLGLLITTAAGALCVTFFGVISVQMRRIEGPNQILAWAQLICGGLFAIEFIIPMQIWQAAAYRPELNPEITYRLHDMGWLFFLGVVSTAVLQFVMIGWAILADRRAEPVFPRWLGYLTLWCGLVFTGGGLIVFFKSGPLAWTGVIAFWLVVVAFGIWIAGMLWGLLKIAIPSHAREMAEQEREPVAA